MDCRKERKKRSRGVFTALVPLLTLFTLCLCASCRRSEQNKPKQPEPEKDLLDNILISVPIWRDKWVNEEHFNLLLDADVDMVVAVTGVENETFDTSRHMLQVAAETKRADKMLQVLVHSNVMASGILQYSEEEIESLLSEFRDHEALGGYHIVDEPYDAIPFVRIERFIKSLDSSKIADINFLPGLAYGSYEEFSGRVDDYLTLLGGSASYLSFDNYPFPNGKGAVSEMDLFGNFEVIRKAGLKHGVPTAFYLQAVGGFGNSYRRPDEGTLRYHASSALAYGFKWIKYWSWFVPDYGDPEATYDDYTDAIIGKDGKPTEMYDVVSKMHKEIHTVGSTLAKLDAAEVYHTGSRSSTIIYEKLPQDFFLQPRADEYAMITRFVHQADGSAYLMIVNKDMVNPQEMHFQISGLHSVKALDKETAGKLNDTDFDGKFLSVTLAPGDYMLYKIEGPAVEKTDGETNTEIPAGENLLPYARISANDSLSGNGWFISRAFDGILKSTAASNGWRVSTDGEKWLEFAFAQPVSFNRLTLYPAGRGVLCGSAFPSQFQLYASQDGKDWKLLEAVEAIAQPAETVPSYPLAETTAQYVRLVFESKNGLGFELAEIKLYHDGGSYTAETTSYKQPSPAPGENVALGKSCFASGSHHESTVDKWGLAYLTDGSKMQTEEDGTNGWMSNSVKEVTQEVFGGVNLGNLYEIDRIAVYPRKSGAYFPSDYEIQISADGVNWTAVASRTNDSGAREARIFDFDPATAKYVRILSKKLSDAYVASAQGYLMQLSEIEVFAAR